MNNEYSNYPEENEDKYRQTIPNYNNMKESIH